MAASFVKSNFLRSLAWGLALTALASSPAVAQFGGGNGAFFGDVVGGVTIDANGVVTDQKVRLSDDELQQVLTHLKGGDADLQNAVSMRMISLKGLDATIAAHRAEGKPLPPEVQFLAGLQRVEYVIAVPDQNDVIIAGPGEGWTVNENGSVVGATTGMPVLRLEDLLVAMRSAQNARQGTGISVSIDPTEEGVKRLQQLTRQIQNFQPEYRQAFEEAMGDQLIRLTGVPQDSRFSQVLVAADYKMKRLSMGLEPSPLQELPSIPAMAQQTNARMNSQSPRFWMECSYDPVATSEDKLVWKIRGQGVQTLTEDGFFDKEGKAVNVKGKSNKLAKRWADTMTEKFDELSKHEPVFRELRNLMDLSVVAAIISRENLLQQVSCELSTIDGSQPVSVPAWNVPRKVPSQCSFVKLTREWVVFTSGGVQVDSWSVAANTETVPALNEIAGQATERTTDRWWWNGAN